MKPRGNTEQLVLEQAHPRDDPWAHICGPGGASNSRVCLSMKWAALAHRRRLASPSLLTQPNALNANVDGTLPA